MGTRKQGRHWSALEARSAGRRPKAGTGLHWGNGVPAEGRHWARECPAEGRHGLHWARECRPKAGTGHGSAGRRPALGCTGARSARPKAGTPVPVRHCLHLGRGRGCRRRRRRCISGGGLSKIPPRVASSTSSAATMGAGKERNVNIQFLIGYRLGARPPGRSV